MLLYWRRFDKVEKEHRKKAEKEAMEQRRQDEEMREVSLLPTVRITFLVFNCDVVVMPANVYLEFISS